MGARKMFVFILSMLLLCTVSGCSLVDTWLHIQESKNDPDPRESFEPFTPTVPPWYSDPRTPTPEIPTATPSIPVSPTRTPTSTPTMTPSLPTNYVQIPDLTEVNASQVILILGNSFVSTSKVGRFLNDMLFEGSTHMECEAVSRGYASVLTYTSDTAMMEAIAQGQYSYVFLCGFYSYGDAAAVQDMVNVCKASDTGLVLFPAHNEQQEVLNAVSGVPVLNWKKEINSIISRGVAYSDFCIDDAHQHSTPLAGYIGAGLIYRAIFEETPPPLLAAPMSMWQVEEILGSYVHTWNLEHVCK